MSAQGSLHGSFSPSPIEHRAVFCALLGITLLAFAGAVRLPELAARLGPEPGPSSVTAPVRATPPSNSDARDGLAAQPVDLERVAAIPTLVTDPPRPGQPSYLGAIGAGVGWTRSGQPSKVIVAVVDSGVDINHPALVGHIWVNPLWRPNESGASTDANDCAGDRNGCSFVSAETADRSCGYQSTGPSGAIADDNGHGTFVAGVVVAAADNRAAASTTGNVDVQILPVKVLDCTGEGRASQAAAGIRYAARSGARIIVLAFSGSADVPALRDAVFDARETYGALVVAAAGNDSSHEAQFPSGYQGVIGVGGTGVVRADSGQIDYSQVAPFSNISAAVHLLAPAVAIRGPVPRVLCGHRDWGCTDSEPYAYASGTSYATPLVAGALALLFAYDADLTPDQATHLLTSTVKPVNSFLVGQVDIGAALALTQAWREGSQPIDRVWDTR